jgi:fatty acid desaturase
MSGEQGAMLIHALCWVNYHFEHHLMVFVPCWRLPAVHARLLAWGYGARLALAPSYVALLRQATTSAAS